MTLVWKKPLEHKAPQGKKILHLKNGDVSVRQRFGKYWLPIPYIDSKFSDIEEPELWADIDLPGDLTGTLMLMIDSQLYNLDDFEIKYPEIYKCVVKTMLAAYEAELAKRQKDAQA